MDFFVGQIITAGTLHNLTAASDLVFAETSWCPADNEQASMRIHRIGQALPCLVRFATLEDSLDMAIQRVCARKLADTSVLFDVA